MNNDDEFKPTPVYRPRARIHPYVSDQAQPIDDESEIDLVELVRTFWRGKFLIIGFAVLGLVLGVYFAYGVAVSKYTSSADVMLENRQEQLVDLDSIISGLSADQATVNTEVLVMRSRRLAQKLVEHLNLTDDPEFNTALREGSSFSPGALLGAIKEAILGPSKGPALDEAQRQLDSTVGAVLEAVSVKNMQDSYVFTITATTESPRKSALLANTLAELYIEDQITVKREATVKATDWLGERVAELKQTLETADAEVKKFVGETELVSPETLVLLNRQLKDLRDRISAAEEQSIEQASLLATYVAAIDSGDVDAMLALSDDPALARMSGTDVQAIRARFARVTGELRTEQRRTEAQLTALRSSLIKLEADVQNQSADLVTLQQLQREAEASRLIYETFLNRLKEATVQQGIQQADSRVLSSAVVPIRPSEPRRSVILALSLALGGLLGMAVVFVRQMIHSGFRTAEMLEQASGVTVMGQIPTMPVTKRDHILGYLINNPTSAAAEAIRNLRTSVLLSNIDQPPQVIMSTSSVPGEGKTTQAVALAQNLGQMGRRVLLVEGDIRRRTMNAYFDVDHSTGLIAVLSGDKTIAEAIQQVEGLKADILVGEKTSTNAADVFASETFQTFLASARAEYDVIVIDTPPVLVVPDARVIATHADAVLYNVKWDSTSRQQVKEGLRQLAMVNVRVTGLVLAQVDPKGMKGYGYGDRYGAYSTYGKSYYDA